MIRNIYTVVAALAAAAVISGCSAAVDKAEIEQASNPVAQMHTDLQKKLDADKDKVDWYALDDALIKAREDGKPVMVFFYATWCHWCKKFESETMKDAAVVNLMASDFVAVRIDAESANTVVYQMRKIPMYELADKFKVAEFPTIWFLEPDGTKAKMLKGYMDPAEFKNYLAYIRSGEYRNREF